MKRLLALIPLLLLLVTTRGAAYATPEYAPVLVATGFTVPTGLLVQPDGTMWVAESGQPGKNEVKSRNFETGADDSTANINESARIVRVSSNGRQTVMTVLPTLKIGQAMYGAHQMVLHDDTLYVATTAWADYIETERPEFAATVAGINIKDGSVRKVGDLFEYEERLNPDGYHKETDPFGIAMGPDGKLWVTDAGANCLYKVDPKTGVTDLVSIFGGMFSPIPNPNRNNQMTTDPVPTGIAIAKDGTAYVALLSGAPFLPGSSKIMQIKPDGKTTAYATDLTMIISLRFGPDGNLYALQFGEFKRNGPAEGSGKLLRIKPGKESEVILSGLETPTDFNIMPNGDTYMINRSWGDPGSGQIVRIKGLLNKPSEGIVTHIDYDIPMTAWAADSAPSSVITATVASSSPPVVWIVALVLAALLIGALVLLWLRRSLKIDLRV